MDVLCEEVSIRSLEAGRVINYSSASGCGENMNVCENIKSSHWPHRAGKALLLVNCDHPPLLWGEMGGKKLGIATLQIAIFIKWFRVDGNYAQNKIHGGMRVVTRNGPKLVVFIYFERSLITGCNFYWHSSSISELLKEQKLIKSPRRLIAWHLQQHRWYLVTTGRSPGPGSRGPDVAMAPAPQSQCPSVDTNFLSHQQSPELRFCCWL